MNSANICCCCFFLVILHRLLISVVWHSRDWCYPIFIYSVNYKTPSPRETVSRYTFISVTGWFGCFDDDNSCVIQNMPTNSSAFSKNNEWKWLFVAQWTMSHVGSTRPTDEKQIASHQNSRCFHFSVAMYHLFFAFWINQTKSWCSHHDFAFGMRCSSWFMVSFMVMFEDFLSDSFCFIDVMTWMNLTNSWHLQTLPQAKRYSYCLKQKYIFCETLHASLLIEIIQSWWIVSRFLLGIQTKPKLNQT